MSRIQKQRFELKYIVPEALALAARDFVASYLEIDEFGATQPNLSYPVHSLYLDSDHFYLHQSTINGDKNRYKLRIRFYENRPGSPVYFEIKRRMDNTISKERGAVKREAVRSLLAGHFPAGSDMASDDPAHLVAVQSFCDLVNRLQAKPRVHVAYLREAWMPADGDNSIRVTFDRDVLSCPDPDARLSPDMEDPISVFGDSVVLELKFTGRFPNWLREFVRVFGLRQASAAKYVDGIVIMEDLQILHKTFPRDQIFLPSLSVSSPERAEKRKRKIRESTDAMNLFIPEKI